MFIAVIANLICNIIWIFVWGYSHIGVSQKIYYFSNTKIIYYSIKWALLFIVLIMTTLYIALFISFRKLKENEQILRDEGL